MTHLARVFGKRLLSHDAKAKVTVARVRHGGLPSAGQQIAKWRGIPPAFTACEGIFIRAAVHHFMHVLRVVPVFAPLKHVSRETMGCG